jgi:hypothetical protein
MKTAVMVALAFAYQARLPRRSRHHYRRRLSNRSGHLSDAKSKDGEDPRMRDDMDWLQFSAAEFEETVERVQHALVRHMHLPPGIAVNEALRENLFMVLISVLNSIPIFIVGKPGSSKSLAMSLLSDNLQGGASHNAFLRSLPALMVYPYQCSPLSTSQGIEATVAQARSYRRSSPGTITVVLLDEVGLAECSPHLPLKVLHKVLDQAEEREALVGISNWTLDPAKMNRAVFLYRPAPTVEDLADTAWGMVSSGSGTISGGGGSSKAALKGCLQSLAIAYAAVYTEQQRRGRRRDFWGLREFYAVVKFISRSLEGGEVSGDGANNGGDEGNATGSTSSGQFDAELLVRAVQRNFGGQPEHIGLVTATFLRAVGMISAGSNGGSGEATQAGTKDASGAEIAVDVINLIRQNLHDSAARHLMILTRNSAALPLLFEQGVLQHEKAEVIVGSNFPNDKSDLNICQNIERVKSHMAAGRTVVLLHCDPIYESLYDLLNGHYVVYGDRRFVRIAFGSYSRLCAVHESFRVIVVVEAVEAYTTMAPPFLNRFEKQVLLRRDALTPSEERLLLRVGMFTRQFAKGTRTKAVGASAAGAGDGIEGTPYGGDVQAAMRAGDQSAVRKIYRLRRQQEQQRRQEEQQEGKQEEDDEEGSGTFGDLGAGEDDDGYDEDEDEQDRLQGLLGRRDGGGGGGKAGETSMDQRLMRFCFCGHHSDMLSSLGLRLRSSSREAKLKGGQDGDSGAAGDRIESEEVLLVRAVEELLWITPPEAVCKYLLNNDSNDSSSGGGVGEGNADGGSGGSSVGGSAQGTSQTLDPPDLRRIYFEQQVHSSLGLLIVSAGIDWLGKWSDELGACLNVHTYAPLTPDGPAALRYHLQQRQQQREQRQGGSESAEVQVQTLVLHELSSERDLEKAAGSFFRSTTEKGRSNGAALLLIQCDPAAASMRQVSRLHV